MPSHWDRGTGGEMDAPNDEDELSIFAEGDKDATYDGECGVKR